MTTTEIILIVIAVLIMLAGLYMMYRGMKRRAAKQQAALIRDKNGIPILPRHERNLVDEPDFDDSLGGETVITPDRSHLQAVIDETPAQTDAMSAYDATAQAYDSDHLTAEQAQWEAERRQADDQEVSALSKEILDDKEAEPDLFSNLASATANISPAVETAEAPAFTENSPILDNHLMASADQDQNSPLNHATENVNITLVPEDGFRVIDGVTLLAIVDQYGMKYGAMNMFHRYENKDGTGILWFSMMGVNHDGITPFDLNTLPQSRYNGLVFFLSLPHPKALQGFDSMISSAVMIAKELDLKVLDENHQPLTREQKQKMRHQIREFQY
ncbi:cell division protein ZipA C-terminal FtsZ-binding domain-containing protein [Psychrobacter sp. I-STPA6b]|uniref:cell division protein ZipA C-terminal FtsZ-binding domain-containing protein n=1 Tax=Psychrobacter sp. I-STPA6b TaxID=2585718 RepID=UPI001D0CA342|nr:cell division protein ZipA C-terminal FtsZ-binding domain-containing protein [Psychrobacter sp. I-STPA6b]